MVRSEGGKRTYTETRDFCISWQANGGDVEATAKDLGLKPISVRVRALKLIEGDEEKGIPPYDFLVPPVNKPRGRKRNVAEVCAEVEELRALFSETE